MIGTWRSTQSTASYPGFSSITAIKDPNKRNALAGSSELPGRHKGTRDGVKSVRFVT